MPGQSKILTQKHARIVKQAQNLIERLVVSDAVPTADQRAEIDRLTAEASDLREARDSFIALEKLAAEGDVTAEVLARTAGHIETQETDDITSAGLREMGLGYFDGDRSAARAVDISLAQPRALKDLIRSGMGSGDLIQSMQMRSGPGMAFADAAKRVMSTETATASSPHAGFTIPKLFERTLYDYMEFIGGVRAAGATVIGTDGGGPLTLPTVSAHYVVNTGTLAALTAEDAAIAETEDTYGEVTLNAHKYTALLDLTRELLEDTGVDLVGYISRSLGRILGKKTEWNFTRGDGTAKPEGVTIGITAAKTTTTAAANAVAYGEILALPFGLDAGYLADRSGSVGWMMAPSQYGLILALGDTTGRSYFQPAETEYERDRILGRPVFYNAFQQDQTTNNAILALFGHFADAYVIREVNGVRISVGEPGFKKDEVTYKATIRVDGQVRDDNALVALKAKA